MRLMMNVMVFFLMTSTLFADDRREFLYQYIPKDGVGCEVGVETGNFSELLLANAQPSKLYLIDPWAAMTRISPHNGAGCFMKQEEYDKLYLSVHNKFKNHSNVTILRMRGEAAAELFEDETFDWVYIDGDHSYEGAFTDFFKYFARLKDGGVLIADDFPCEGVRKAFMDFRKICKDIDTVKVEGSQLIVFKKKKS